MFHLRRRTLAVRSIALAVAAIIPHPAAAQDADSVMVARTIPRWSSGAISFQVGAAHMGLNAFNDAMTANGRPAFSTDAATVGVAGYARFGRLVIGGSGETALPQRKSSSGWNNRVTFGSATFDAGVAVLDQPRVHVQSFASFGLRTTSLRMEQRGDLVFTDGVRNPARNLELSSINALAGAGVAAEVRFATQRTGAFSLGIRAGFARPLGGPSMRAGESTVSGAPREAAGQYLRFSISKPIGRRREVTSALSTAILSLLTR